MSNAQPLDIDWLNPAGLADLRAQLNRFWNQALATYKQIVERTTDEEGS